MASLYDVHARELAAIYCTSDEPTVGNRCI